MIIYFKEEFKRVIMTKKYTYYLMICMCFLIVTIFGILINGIKECDYLPVFTFSSFTSVLYIILPLWVAIPYALSYANERDSGFENIILMKISRKEYVLAKYLVNTCVSGLSIFIPFSLWYIIIICFTGFDINGRGISVEMKFCEELFNNNPFLFGILIIINSTICAVILSNLCLAFTSIIKNKLVAYIMPFALYIISGIASTIIDIRLDLMRIFSLWNRGNTSLSELLAYELFLIIVGILLYIIGYVVNEYDR